LEGSGIFGSLVHDVRGFASLAPPACSSRGKGVREVASLPPSGVLFTRGGGHNFPGAFISREESAGAWVALATQANVGQGGIGKPWRDRGFSDPSCTTFGRSLRSPLRRALHGVKGFGRSLRSLPRACSSRGLGGHLKGRIGKPWRDRGFSDSSCTTFGASLRSPLRRALHGVKGFGRSLRSLPRACSSRGLGGHLKGRIGKSWGDRGFSDSSCTTFGASLRSPLRRALHGVKGFGRSLRSLPRACSSRDYG